MALRSYTPSIQNGNLEFCWYTGFIYLPLAENLIDIDVREVVRTDTFSIPVSLPLVYGITARWNMALYKIIAPIGEPFFNGNPVSYKRGFYSPKLDVYNKDRFLIQYDKQYSQTYSFVWASGYTVAPDIVPLQPSVLGLTKEYVNPVASVIGDAASAISGILWANFIAEPATGVSLQFNPGCTYVLSIVYNAYLQQLNQNPLSANRLLSQV